MRTRKQFLQIALRPVGHTMYIWGGGWNAEDDGAGHEAVTRGVSPRWAAFAAQQGPDYDWHTTKYQIHDGLDCSGYVGWAVYNLRAGRDGLPGFVMPAGRMAADFAARGWGAFTPAQGVRRRSAGDILSTNGHVYISLGDCTDGSALLVHASPPGVQVCGTVTPKGETDSEAIRLARAYMARCHPNWHARYPDCARGAAYLTDYDQFSWFPRRLPDPEGLSKECAGAVLTALTHQ